MRLARKFTFAIAIAILAVMAVYDYTLIHEEVILFDADLERTEHLKRLVRASVESVWRAHGEAVGPPLTRSPRMAYALRRARRDP